MTSVNSPACLLARNHFYRSLPASAEPMKPTLSCQNKQRPATLWVAMETAPGLPGLAGAKALWVSIVLGSSSTVLFTTSKPTNPSAQRAK